MQGAIYKSRKPTTSHRSYHLVVPPNLWTTAPHFQKRENNYQLRSPSLKIRRMRRIRRTTFPTICYLRRPCITKKGPCQPNQPCQYQYLSRGTLLFHWINKIRRLKFKNMQWRHNNNSIRRPHYRNCYALILNKHYVIKSAMRKSTKSGWIHLINSRSKLSTSSRRSTPYATPSSRDLRQPSNSRSSRGEEED